MDPRLKAVVANMNKLTERFDRLEERVSKLEDSVDVIEEHTCENYNAISELSEWKEQVEKIIDEY